MSSEDCDDHHSHDQSERDFEKQSSDSGLTDKFKSSSSDSANSEKKWAIIEQR